ncbi:MAG: HAD-IA family hydrolase [Candidatus Nealsonbacteria bacterium]|nr:HAD-IA family hydrolase [Candidatus Nealsonbacteria bacterium]
MIKAITFDLDGVYFPNGKANFIKALMSLGVAEDEAKRVFLKSDQMNQLYKNGKITDEEFWTWAAREWRLDKTPQELIDLLIAGYDIDQRVAETVRKVRANGYKTLICSNNFKARIEGLQRKFGFLNDFDAQALSYEIGASKPSEIIFQELVKKASVPAQTIVFADDNSDNLAGARNLGIITFLYEGFDKFIEQLNLLGAKI